MTGKPSTIGSRQRAGAAFTLIEMIVAISVLVLVIGLLAVGLNRAKKSAEAAAGAMNVASLKTATEKFVRDFGFPPPMIKDFSTGYPEVYTTVAGEKRLSVYQPSSVTPTGIADRDFLRRDPPPTLPNNWSVGGTPPPEIKDLYDTRYSNVSLPFYLAGASDEKGGTAWQVPIDGLVGPGFLEPRQDGTFAVPEDLKKAAATKSSKSTGRTFAPLIDTSKGGLQIVVSGDQKDFRDAKGRKYRYYLWIQGDKQGRKLGIGQLNIPRIILETMSRPEDRFKPVGTTTAADHRASLPELSAATWAILYPGPDGLFGDEIYTEIADKLGITIADIPAEIEARKKAIADNVVEVGGQ